MGDVEGGCSGGQECVPYKECLHGKKLFGRILAIKGEGDEKTKLMKEFKSMRCGNFNRDKTVCCDVEGVTYIGSFKNHLHDVTGDIYTIDGIDNQIQIRRFTYDGAGKDTFFWSGNEGKEPTSEKGFVLEYPYKGRSTSMLNLAFQICQNLKGMKTPLF